MASTGPDKIGERAQAIPDSLSENKLPQGSDVPDESVADGQMSKNGAKKAAKREKQAADKASKSKGKPIKAPKKKIEGAALIGIDVTKEDDFSGWYQQVLTKGDMLDYYDVSGCYILKVSTDLVIFLLL
jgi:prolyl-tRNA synthetase